MKQFILLTVAALAASSPMRAVDLYGATPTAQSIALGGIYFGSPGPTDALASNPAALVLSDRPILELTGMRIFSSGQFRNSTSYPGVLNNGGSISGSAGFALPLPGARFTLGAAVFPTAMLSGKWRYQDPPGTAGVSYGVQTNKSAFLAMQTSVGAGFQVSRALSLGAGLGIVENINTLETPYIFQSNPTLAGLKALLHLHTTGVGYNGTFGAVINPSSSVEVGLSYKTRTAIRSTGTATGDAGALFSALELPFDPNYRYKAEVDNVFPQSASLALAWTIHHYSRLYLQSDWLNWRTAFHDLSVHLTEGNNTLLNSLLASGSLNDSIPLRWRNQVAIRAGFSLPFTESVSWQAGYAYTNNPVPSGTLTPLTAAIMSNSVSTGLNYQRSRYRVQLGYQVNLPATASVRESELLAGEYDDSRTRLWIQTLALTTGIRF